jgi:hypothetical protein
VGTPEAFAAAFLTAAETGMLGVESPDYTEDLRTRRIGRAMRAAGVHEVEILGGGSFGMAGATQDGRVVKLTTDESEVEAGSVLRGQHLPHVVHIDGSWFVRRTRVVKWNTGVEHRVGMLLMERVEPIDQQLLGNDVTVVWAKVREAYGAVPWKLVKMSRADARATLYAASTALERQLRDVGSKLAVEVADGLHELRDHKVYGIDVHAGNIGFHRRDGVYKLFDIGASSSPDTANPGELPLETETAPRGMTEEGVQVEEIGGEGPRQAELILTPEQIETARDMKSVGFIQMPPTSFLQLTSLMLSGSGNVNSYDEIMRTAAPLAEYNARPARVPPYLSVDVATGQVLEHEGRHRAAAVKKASGNVVPIAIRLMQVEGRSESVISPRTGIRLKDMPRTLLDENGQGYRVPISLDGAIDLYAEDGGAHEAPRKTRLTRADCSHIQEWLFAYLNIDVDPYDFNFAIKDWIEQEEITDDGTPYAEPTDVMPEDLSPDQLKAFTKWLKKSGELDLYTREMPFEAPAYLTLHAKTKMPPGSWFMHFTDAHFNHFTQGATLDGLHLSTWKKRKDLANCSKNLSDTQGLAEVVFGFAYAAENLEQMQDVDAGARKYGRNAVVFQCDCAVEAYHDGDDEFQSIFPVCAEYNLHSVSVDHAMGLGLDDEAGNTMWFKNLPELIAHLESKPKRRRERAPRTAAEAHHERSRIARGETTGFYHGSWDDLPIGTILEGRRWDMMGNHPVEKLLEALRPSSAVQHDHAVFMVRDPALADEAGGGGGGDYLYEVEPIGQVNGPYDGGWWSEMSKLSLDYRDMGRTRNLVKYQDAVALAVKYWNGDRCGGDLCAGVWEYLTPQAKIVRRVRRRVR